ncbi:YXWGXW repeat-containing protein [Granulicella sp. S190]|uniref:YXWGXW repeat-containing protein n=1 Tax=Granulicella sp. S190 TaxID=1747226 RepID=UPI00131C6427|nr:YXWGXW repeat-containing protein [Granulicella sp. S190]
MCTKPSIRHLLLALLLMVVSSSALAQVDISVSFGPPALPVYEQPLCPGDGYIWTPGYWAWDNDNGDYYWVPGTWVEAPEVGYLWTPGYWGWGDGAYLFHTGYWGPHVGFYGGISYGFGYFGDGYEGGRWDGGHFFYNRTVNNVNIVNIHNTYNTTIVHNTTIINRVSYNGGNGGIEARATSQQEAIAQERHIPPVQAQVQHVQTARSNPQLRASVNQGKPPIAATARPTQFSGQGVVAAHEAGAPYHPPANRPNAEARPATPDSRSVNPAHASELQPHQAPAPPNTGNAKLDQKYQQQQAKLIAKQNQEHQQLQQKQEAQHQQLAQKNASDARKQQVEQQHQQQTQQMEQRHTQQQQQLQQRQPQPHAEARPR